MTGYAGDRFGRRPINLLVLFFYFIFSFASVFSFNVWFYSAVRIFCGFCQGGYVAMAYLLMIEITDKKYLAQLSMSVMAFYALGEVFATAIGYLLKDSWRYQILTISLVLIPIFILNIFLVPESPLWLHSKGRVEEAQHILRRLAKLNKRDPSVIVLLDKDSASQKRKSLLGEDPNMTLVSDEEDSISASQNQILIKYGEENKSAKDANVSIVDLFRTTPAIMMSVGQISAWFAISLVYFGLIFGVGDIGGDVYVNSALLASVELTVCLFFMPMNYFGRKPTFLFCLIISSIACVVLPFTKPLADGKVQIVFALISKCMAAGGFDLLYTYSPELYPTVLRGTGLLLCSASAR